MGPAIIKEPTGTNIIEPAGGRDQRIWPPDPDPRHSLDRQEAIGTDADPVMLEVFNNLFMSIAEQMGATLANTAYSVNIKERLDFSCALFDPTAGLWPMRRMCGASGLDVGIHPYSDPAEPRHETRRCLRAERAFQRRHPFARYHRGHPGFQRRRNASAVLCRLARAPRGYRRAHARGPHRRTRHISRKRA